MKNVKIPMNATRAMRLSKALSEKGASIAAILREGLKNLDGGGVSRPKV